MLIVPTISSLEIITQEPQQPLTEHPIHIDTPWINRYSGIGNYADAAKAMAMDNEGNIYVTGSSRAEPGETEIGPYDIVTIKYNNDGRQEWVARWDNQLYHLDDLGSAIAVDASGNVYVTGKSLVAPLEFNIVTIKYNTLGVKQWEDFYYGGHSRALDYPEKIVLDGNGNVYVTGSIEGFNNDTDVCLLKYTINGERLWVRCYNAEPNGFETANNIAAKNDFVVVVAGVPTMTSGFDFLTLKYSDEGDLLWEKTYDYAFLNDYAYAVVIDEAENIYVTGSSNNEVALLAYDFATIKYSPDGTMLWIQRYDALANDPVEISVEFVSDIVLNNDGNVVVTGKSIDWIGELRFPEYYATLCYTIDGELLWVNRHYVYRGDYPALAVDSLGNIYVCGSCAGGPTSYDFFTIRLTATGDESWVQVYNGPANDWDIAADVVVDGTGNVFVTGYSTGVGTNRDFTTIKYHQVGAPRTPSTPSPKNYAEDIPNTAFLGWTGGITVPGDTVTYDVYFGTTNPPPKVKNNQSETSFSTGAMTQDTNYYWQIISWADSGLSTVGPLWRFSTRSSDYDPPIITQITPKEGYLYIANQEFIKRGFSKPCLLLGPITIEVQANDIQTGIKNVEFYIDGAQQHADSKAPYTFLWNDRFFSLKEHTIKVIVYDNAGNHKTNELKVYKIF